MNNAKILVPIARTELELGLWLSACKPVETFTIEVCMGMGKTGIPWVPWDSHGNGSKISHGMGMVMGIKCMGMGVKTWELVTRNCEVSSVLT